MKKHNLLKVVLLTLLVVIVAAWFLPVTNVTNGEFVTKDASNAGLFTIGNNFSTAVQYFGSIAIYVLAVGGLYGVLHSIPQYRILLDKIVKCFANKEWLFMVIVGILFAALSSMAGLAIVLIAFFPLVISVILLMGYDKITAVMLTVGSTIAGLIGTVYNTNAIYGAYNVIGEMADTNVLYKLILLVGSLALVILNTILYGNKHKDKNKNIEATYVPEKVTVKKKHVYPIVIALCVVLVVFTLAFFDWTLFEVDLFNKMSSFLETPSGSSITKNLLGAINKVIGITAKTGFGAWTLGDASVVLLTISWLVSFAYRKKFNDYLSAFGAGVKKAVLPAFLVLLSYTILVSAVNNPVEMSVLKYIVDLKVTNTIGMTLIMCVAAIVYCLFTVESYYGIISASSYIQAVTTASTVGLVALIWQSMYGITMLIAPTSIALVATLSYLDIPYTKWLKAIWKLALELLALCVLVLIIFNCVAI
jgi:uncharacterized ion transporter superfamily protein YfcC